MTTVIQSRFSRFQFIDVAELRAFEGDNISNGESVTLIGGAIPGDGAGGDLHWDSTSTASEDAPASVGWVVKRTDEATGRFIRTDRSVVRPEHFGARSGLASTVAIQAALDKAKSLTEPFPAVEFGFGEFLISSELDRTGTGNYVDIRGQGQRNTIIRATAAMDSIFKLANDLPDIHRATTIEDMTLDCGNNANLGVDAQNMRYWTMVNVEVKNAVVACAQVGNWDTSVLNNNFNNSPIAVLVDGIVSFPNATNNLSIHLNEVTFCPQGVKIVNYANNIIITVNRFDICEDAAIFFAKGSRGAVVEWNFFEKCGKTGTGVDVNFTTTAWVTSTAYVVGDLRTESSKTYRCIVAHTSGVFATDLAAGKWLIYSVVPAAIVCGFDPAALGDPMIGEIQYNWFADCNTDRLISVWNVEDLVIRENWILDSSTVENFVELRGEGSDITRSRRFEVTGSYDPTIVTQILGLDGKDPDTSHSTDLVENTNQVGTEPRAYFAVNDPSATSWTSNTNVNQAVLNFAWAEFEFDVVTETSQIDIDLPMVLGADSPLRGRYVRVHFQTKGSSGVSGVLLTIDVDGVEVMAAGSPATSSYQEFGRGRTVYIPVATTAFRVRLRSASSSLNSKIYGFCVCDAGIPMAATPIKRVS